MSSLAHAPRLCDVRPSLYAIDRAVNALRVKLQALGYSPVRIGEIVVFAHDEEYLGGAVEAGLLDPADVAAAEAAFVDGWPDVDPRSVLWKNPDRWAATEPPPDMREALEYALMSGEFDPIEVDAPLIPPPDLEPDDRDFAEWAEWSMSIDDRNPWLDYETAELDEVGISRR